MDDLTTAGVELAVVVAYGRIIPARLLEQIPMVNLHFSLLPRWRGAAPVERAILAGDRETGVCLMKVEEGLDTGPVYAVRTVPLDDDITLAALRTELVDVASALVVDALAARGRRACPTPCRRRARSRMAEKISKEDLHLDWAEPAVELKRVVRLGRAWTTFRGKRLTVLDAALAPDERRRRTQRPPGSLDGRGRRDGQREPCVLRAGAAREPFSHVSRGVAAWRAARRPASVSGRTRHGCGDRDSDRRVEPRPVRAVPFGTPAALRRPADAVPPRPGWPRRRPRLRHGRPDQDPARGDGGRARRSASTRPRPCWPGPSRPTPTWPGLSFAQGDIATWLDEGLDLVFANASLQWIDDHLNLLARMRTALGPDGQLAFQVPANYRHPSHLLAQAVANEPPFIDALYGDVPEDRGRFVLSPELYADLLYELGAKDQVVRMEVYGHELESTSEVVEWVMGTLLTPYRKRLSPELFDAFVERYRERLIEELGEREPYFYGFRRILCWARFG